MYILLFAIIFFPIFPIYAVEGVSSVIRLDLVLSCLLVIFMLADVRFRRHLACQRKLLIAAPILATYLYASSNALTASAQIVVYFTIYCAYYLGMQAIHGDRKLILNTAHLLLTANCLVHVAYHFFQIDSLLIAHTNGFGQIENDVIFGVFGISKMPFQFILYIAAFIFISLIRESQLGLSILFAIILTLVSAATSESRIGFFALVLGLLISLNPARAISIGFLILLFIPYALTDKINSILSFDLSSIAEDQSLGMRLINLENFNAWFSLDRMLFGGGAFSNLQFTSTYGEPGALDMLFVRLLAEFGLPITIIGFFSFILHAKRTIMNNGGLRKRVILGWLAFILFYSIMNEGVIASRSGHLVFFTYGLILSIHVNRKSVRRMQELNIRSTGASAAE